MPSFVSYLNTAIRPEWKCHYMNYSHLKSLLVRFAQRRASLESPPSCTNPIFDEDNGVIARFYNLDETIPKRELNSKFAKEVHLALIEREELCHVLDGEIENVGKFYLEQMRTLHAWMDGLDQHYEEGSSEYVRFGRELLELYAFVGVNVTALQQILIRYDCIIRTLNGPPLGQWYLVQRRVRTEECFEAVFSRRQLILLANKFMLTIIQRDEDYALALTRQISEMEMIIQKDEHAVDLTLNGRWAIEDSIAFRIQYYFLAGSLMSDFMMMPSFIRTRGDTLTKEIQYFAKWREDREYDYDMNGLTPAMSEESSSKGLISLLGPSLILNFVGHFFYMMNHYIVEPSSTKYIRELGGNDALSGLLIGMSPCAALISALVYSLWSNRSFKHPLLCSAVFLTIGSFVYANALRFHSVPVAMAGRFISGLGAPCGLNIRYLADTVPKAQRTAVSAMFMTVSSLGMSLGPGLAVLLDFIDVDVVLPLYGRLVINGMTGPGYLMTLIWCVYLILLILYFEEEERVGLLEIIEMTMSQDDAYIPPSVGREDRFGRLSPTLSSNSTDVKSFYEPQLEQLESKRIINEATIVCMVLKLLGKFVLEILGCSVSIITMHRFGWSVKNIGCLSFVNGCLIIPISTAVGFLSHRYNDRTLLIGLLCMAFTGVLLLVDFTDFGADVNFQYYYYGQHYNDSTWRAVGPKRYIVGIVLEFCGFQAAQSVVLSMMSKVVPLSLAKGTFNSGYIATSLTQVCK